MRIYALGSQLQEIKDFTNLDDYHSIVLTNTEHIQEAIQMTNMVIDGDLDLKNISFCRLETQQECLYGTLYIPKLLDISGVRYKIIFLINKNHMILIDDSDFSYRIINQIQTKKLQQGETIERFMYNYFIQIMSRDIEMMGRYEHFIMSMEEKVMGGTYSIFSKTNVPYS